MKSKTTRETKPSKHPPPQGEDVTASFDHIVGLISSLQALHEQSARHYAPIVSGILRTRSRDVQLIEHTLDLLLDSCGHPAALELFRSLCRHYYFIDQAAAAEYVLLYRDTWEPADDQDSAMNS